MQLAGLDWAIIVGFFVFWLVLGAFVGRKAGESTEQFFLAGRSMPWWLLGFSLVATTFAADTPLFVSGLVRQRGVAGNWNWWAFLLNGMLTVFVFAKLWHRSGLHTDLEFYELRYSGKPAAFLRGFRALYLGTFFNIMIMAVVTLAAIRILGRPFGPASVGDDHRRLHRHGHLQRRRGPQECDLGRRIYVPGGDGWGDCCGGHSGPERARRRTVGPLLEYRRPASDGTFAGL